MKTEQVSPTNILIIGQNAKDNHDIIRHANPTDLWFHVSNFPSAHVILQPASKKSKLIYKAALTAKLHSKTVKFPNVLIVYTPVSNLILTKTQGKVTFINTKLIKIITV